MAESNKMNQGGHQVLDVCVEKFKNNDEDHKTIITKLDKLQIAIIGETGDNGVMGRLHKLEWRSNLSNNIVTIIVGIVTAVITALIIKGVV